MFSPELADRTAYPSLEAAANLAARSSMHGLASLITGGHVPVARRGPAQVEHIARVVVRSLVPGFDG